MIEIIPNWHPIFVHFTLALFTTSVGFYGLSYIFSLRKKGSWILTSEFEIVARWCLWGSAISAIFTVIAGFYAYSTVHHDVPSHEAMQVHRNWALPTAAAILLIVLWSVLLYLKKKKTLFIFFVVLIGVEIALLSTAWHGSELVYRHGVGVMSLPEPPETKHPHHHHSHE